MKKLTILMLMLSGILSILSGCIAYDEPYRDQSAHRSDRDRDYDDHHRWDHDHDRDRDYGRR